MVKIHFIINQDFQHEPLEEKPNSSGNHHHHHHSQHIAKFDPKNGKIKLVIIYIIKDGIPNGMNG